MSLCTTKENNVKKKEMRAKRFRKCNLILFLFFAFPFGEVSVREVGDMRSFEKFNVLLVLCPWAGGMGKFLNAKVSDFVLKGKKTLWRVDKGGWCGWANEWCHSLDWHAQVICAQRLTHCDVNECAASPVPGRVKGWNGEHGEALLLWRWWSCCALPWKMQFSKVQALVSVHFWNSNVQVTE